MSKDNLFLGMARGSVGDVTFSRLNGIQVARARNRAPHNPQSPAQMVQRIVMSTVGKAYSFMSAICDHSFEGFDSGQQSQRKFMEVNVGLMRDKAADVLAYPVESNVRSSDAYNFSFKNDYAPVLNQYQISAGSLPSLQLATDASGTLPILSFDLGELTSQTITYADLVSALGVQRGDQLTFIQAVHDYSQTGHERDILTGFRYARVILDPAGGDMTVPLFSASGFNDPNPRNEGIFTSLYLSVAEGQTGLFFRLGYVDTASPPALSDRHLAASAVILSRQTGGRWARSTQFLMPRISSVSEHLLLNSSTLGLAYDTYRLGASSDLYLNQAE